MSFRTSLTLSAARLSKPLQSLLLQSQQNRQRLRLRALSL